MARCKSCGAEVSAPAVKCQRCAKPVTGMQTRAVWAMAVLVGAGVLSAIWGQGQQTQEREAMAAAVQQTKPPEQRAAEAAAKLIEEREFQLAVRAAKILKAGMKNPASFQLTEAVRTDEGVLCFEYRGTNSFNAVVPSYAVIPPGGQPAAGPLRDVAKAWNKHCANRQATDMMHIVHAM